METVLDCDCTPWCRSVHHAQDLLAVVSRGNLAEVKAQFNRCYNSDNITDSYGRNVLHVAASCSKWEIVDWLLTERKLDANVRDLESWWTPLHRSVFYGQITNALHLIHHGASLTIQDKEALTALDIVRKDRPEYVTFSPAGPTDVYTWGTNTNFTLGHSSQQSRNHPDLVEELAKKKISVKQVIVCKYHSVFLTHDGKVYTCGHGQGGRLGHGNEQTYLTPHVVQALAEMKCEQITAARDHTVILTEGGVVYSCGFNSCHQLGQSPLGFKCVTPKPILTKLLKGKVITGIKACRFHTVLYSGDSVFTFGLNAGQLGFPAGEKYVSYPKRVSALNHKDVVISALSASAAATVCATVKGDIYVLHEYQCRKIASRQLNLIKLDVHGGSLDSDAAKDLLQRERHDELTVVALHSSGKVYCWRPSYRGVKKFGWSITRQIFMSDIALSKHNVVFVTNDGEGFIGNFSGKSRTVEKAKVSPRESGSMPRVSSVEAFTLSAELEQLEKEETELIHLHRLPYIHRAVQCAVDPAGLNFAILQSDPKTSLVDVPSVGSAEISVHLKILLDSTDCMDNIHDIIFKVKDQAIPAHKYILASRSDYFRRLFTHQKVEQEGVDIKFDCASGRDVQVIEIEKIDVHTFTMLLQYIYSEDCDVLNPGYKCVPTSTSGTEWKKEGCSLNLEAELSELSIELDTKKSAYQVFTEQKKKKIQNENKKSGKKKQSVKSKESEDTCSPIRVVQDAAKRYGINTLVKRLEGTKIRDGEITWVQKSNKKVRFDRNKYPSLCDITLESTDGVHIQCHKCILVARLEYFQSMLASGWIETSTNTPLKLPFPGDILSVILDYLYTDESAVIQNCQNVEFVCKVLIIADQLLSARLKDFCQVTLTDLVTLRNVAELLEFASIYNADQLKKTCIQFINLNLASLLDMRALEVLDEDILMELSTMYREMIPAMSRRMITPYSITSDTFPTVTDEDIDSPVSIGTEKGDFKYEVISPEQRVKKSKAKKRSRKRTISTGKEQVTSASSVVIETEEETVNSVRSARPNCHEAIEESVSEMKSSSVTAEPTKSDISSTTESGVQSAVSSQRNLQSEVRADVLKSRDKPAVKANITPTKLSQKQRKKLARQQSQPHTENAQPAADVEQKVREGDTTSKASTSPWGAVIQPSSSTLSFREVMEDEEQNEKTLNRRSSAPIVIATPVSTGEKTFSWGLLSRNRQLSEGDKSATSSPPLQSPTAEPINPWKQPTSPTSPTSSTLRFAEIIQAEVKQTETLVKSLKKPFHLIQIEERAMQGLLAHYQAADNPEEFIHVDRVSATMATPIWKKDTS